MSGFVKLGIQLDPSQIGPWIPQKKRYEHLFCIGGTGSGKTTYFANLIKNDLDAGIIVLDPGGALADIVCAIVPKDRLIKVDKHNPISLNPLSRTHLNNSKNANELVDVVNSAVQALTDQVAITVKMQRIVRQAINVMSGGKLSIEKLSEFLDSKRARDEFFIIHSKPVYWQEFESKGYKYEQLRMSAERVTDRFSLLFEDEDLTPFVSGANQLDIPKIALEKKIVVFDLHGFDDDETALIGNLVTHQIKSYYLHQAKQDSPPLYFYCDEQHLFINRLFNRFLTESRKYNISVNLSGHNLEQVDRKLLSSLLSCYVLVILSANSDDAQALSRELNIKPRDILELGSHEAYLGIGKKPVRVMTYPPPKIPKTAEPPEAPKAPEVKIEEPIAPPLYFLADDPWIMVN